MEQRCKACIKWDDLQVIQRTSVAKISAVNIPPFFLEWILLAFHKYINMNVWWMSEWVSYAWNSFYLQWTYFRILKLWSISLFPCSLYLCSFVCWCISFGMLLDFCSLCFLKYWDAGYGHWWFSLAVSSELVWVVVELLCILVTAIYSLWNSNLYCIACCGKFFRS